jgi:hypothetical protein
MGVVTGAAEQRSPVRVFVLLLPFAVALGAGVGWVALDLYPSGRVSTGTVAARLPSGGTPSSTTPATASPSVATASPAVAVPTPSTSRLAPDARDAATQVERLLDDSATARRAVVAATQGLAGCSLPADTAAAGLKRVIRMRSTQLDQLEGVDFGPLSHGAQLRSALAEAWTTSLDADRSYLAWAENQDVYGACDTADADYRAGNQSSARAVAAKKTFAAL